MSEARLGGSYLYEPSGSEHTLHVADEVTYVSNVKTSLDLYYQSCKSAGPPRPEAILG